MLEAREEVLPIFIGADQAQSIEQALDGGLVASTVRFIILVVLVERGDDRQDEQIGAGVEDYAKRTAERGRLEFEAIKVYDAEFYVTEFIRACESIVSPMGCDRGRIRSYPWDTQYVGLVAFE